MTTLKDWVEVRNGYVSARHITALLPVQVAGGWQVRVHTVDGAMHHLPDQHTTREEARDSAYRLAQLLAGVTEPEPRPADVIDMDVIPQGRPGAGMRPSEYAMTLASQRRDHARVHTLHAEGKTPRLIIKATGLSPAKVSEYLRTPLD